MAPKAIAYTPMSHRIVSAPTPGRAASNTPKTTDAIPASASKNSPSICLRSRTAATISNRPVAMAQMATYSTTASAVTCGL